MGSNLKQAMLDVAKIRMDTVKVGNVSFPVREVGALEFAQYGMLQKAGQRLEATASLIAACVVGEDGASLLSMDEAMQIAKSARVATPIVGAILKLSGFGEDDEKESDAS